MAKSRSNRAGRPKDKTDIQLPEASRTKKKIVGTTQMKRKDFVGEPSRALRTSIVQSHNRRGKQHAVTDDSSTEHDEDSDSFSEGITNNIQEKINQIYKGKMPRLGSPKDKGAIYGLLYSLIEGLKPSSDADGTQPINNFGDVKIQTKTTYYRSNLKAAAKDLQSLKFQDEHFNALKRTPFWILFDSLYKGDRKKMSRRCHKYEEDIRCVLKSYHMRSDSFLIAGELRKLTKTDVKLILGITGGSLPIPLSKRDYEIPLWVRRCFERKSTDKDTAGTYQLYKVYLLDKIKEIIQEKTEESCKDVARLVHCYLLAVFLAPTKNGSINWHITCYCEVFEEIYKYDWCDFVCNMLMDQIKGSEKLRAGGCTLLLLYWVCEITNLVQPVEDGGIPRYLKWDLSALRKKLCDNDLRALKSKYISHYDLEATALEEEAYSNLDYILDNQFNLECSSKEDSDEFTPDPQHLTGDALPEKNVDHCPSSSDPQEHISTPLNGSGRRIRKKVGSSLGVQPTNERNDITTVPNDYMSIKDQSNPDVGANVAVGESSYHGASHTNNDSSDTCSDEERIMNTPDADMVIRNLNKFAKSQGSIHDLDQAFRSHTLISVGNERSATALKTDSNHCGNLNKPFVEFEDLQRSVVAEGCDMLDTTDVGQGDVSEKIHLKNTPVEKGKNSFQNLQFGPNWSLGFTQGDLAAENETRMDDNLKEIVEKCNEEVTKLFARIELLEIRLKEKEEDLKGVHEKLRASTNRMDASAKSLPKLIKQNVELALQEELKIRDSIYESNFKVQWEAFEKLKEENQFLISRLNAEINPTDSQFIARESNLQLIDALADLHVTVTEKNKLQGAHKELVEKIQKETGTFKSNEATELEIGKLKVKSLVKLSNECIKVVETEQQDLEKNGRSDQVVRIENESLATENNVTTQNSREIDEEGLQERGLVTIVNQPQPELSPSLRTTIEKKSVTRTSMVNRVKYRTEMGDRKPVEFSPLAPIKEVVELENLKIDVPETKRRKTKKSTKVPLNSKFGAVKKLREGTISNLSECWSSDQERAIVWIGVKDAHNNILMKDILMILHDERISNSVIDGWGEMILRRYNTLHGNCKALILITSTWDLINNSSTSNDMSLLQTVVDKRLMEEISTDYVLLFPMLTRGKGRHENGDHWTLLKLDLGSYQWTFYNSLKPRTNKYADPHLARSKILVDYVESKLKQIFRETDPNHKLVHHKRKGPVVGDCPQQASGTLDCGVIVCDLIEQIVSKKKIITADYSHEDSSCYRAKMVDWFMDFEDSI